MSLAARCTHCQTVFRISGPQLAAAEGWVRCGSCGQVFDASANLVTPSGQALEIPTVDARAAEPLRSSAAPAFPAAQDRPDTPDSNSMAATALQAMPDIDLELPDLGELKAEAAQERATARDEREPFWVDPGDAAPAQGDQTGAAPQVRAFDEAQTAEPSASEPQASERPDHAEGDLRGALADSHAASPRSDSAAAAPATQSKPSGGLALLTTACLCLSLIGLSAYALRGHIAQTWPQARPLVLQACAALGCQLPPLRLINALAVQGSSLSLDDSSGHHRLRLQLRNTSDGPVVTPAFDFSLVAGDGQVLARRMLDPTEFESSKTQLEAQSEMDLAITLDLRTLEAAAIASFRVVPYYP